MSLTLEEHERVISCAIREGKYESAMLDLTNHDPDVGVCAILAVARELKICNGLRHEFLERLRLLHEDLRQYNEKINRH